MNKNLVHTLHGEILELLPEKAALLPEHEALLIADVHLGKVSHFRKAGMAIPAAAAQKNLEMLKALLHKYETKRVLFMGDLFHSDLNAEWIHFRSLLDQFSQRSFELIGGNHDVLHPDSYKRAGLLYHKNYLLLGKLRLIHEPQTQHLEAYYDLCGHLHPGYRLSGKGKQALTLPCFWMSKHTCVLPAFGHFTGLHPVQPQPGDTLYICIGNTQVQQVHVPPVKK